MEDDDETTLVEIWQASQAEMRSLISPRFPFSSVPLFFPSERPRKQVEETRKGKKWSKKIAAARRRRRVSADLKLKYEDTAMPLSFITTDENSNKYYLRSNIIQNINRIYRRYDIT